MYKSRYSFVHRLLTISLDTDLLWKGGTPHLLYPTSKGAIVNLTRAMAAHHAAEGIRVNCVCPGVS